MSHSQTAERTDRVTSTLKSVFGYDAFRPNQESIVRAVMAGRDVFAVMPTGGGKSLCFQLPAHLLHGTCVVVSPLISLMKDQVDAAHANGLRAEFLNSHQDKAERAAVLGKLQGGRCDLLYVSPERFAVPGFMDALKRLPLCLFAIDEAHCISDWGHDFRPDYLGLASLVGTFPHVPVAAFTATATMPVQQDIIAKLGLRRPLTLRASFNRPNLFYRVVPKQDLGTQLLSFVGACKEQSGIVYRSTRKGVETTAAFLSSRGVKALAYHAGLDAETRKRNQDDFIEGKADVIVATIAFGMGIDKPDIRYVLHGDLPKNIESYYQETGRAGRDGQLARCVLFFDFGDIPKIRYFIDKIESEAHRRVAGKKLQEVIGYCTHGGCRRSRLLAYFGERYPAKNCAACDSCKGTGERVDATREARIVLSAIARTRERFGISHIIDVVTGAYTEKVRKFEHDTLKTFGVGRDRAKPFWRRLIGELLGRGVVERAGESFPVLRLAPGSEALLRGTESFSVLSVVAGKRRAPAERRVTRADPRKPPDADSVEQRAPQAVRGLDRRLQESGAR